MSRTIFFWMRPCFTLPTIVLLSLLMSACGQPPGAPAVVAGLPVGMPGWLIKEQQLEEQERQEQAEQLELSKDWPLEFPQGVRENELAGVIVDPEGHPLAGALVDLFPALTGHETTTDEQGMFRYQFEGARPQDTVEVQFSKDAIHRSTDESSRWVWRTCASCSTTKPLWKDRCSAKTGNLRPTSR